MDHLTLLMPLSAERHVTVCLFSNMRGAEGLPLPHLCRRNSLKLSDWRNDDWRGRIVRVVQSQEQCFPQLSEFPFVLDFQSEHVFDVEHVYGSDSVSRYMSGRDL